MQKELTVFLICLLALAADVLCFQQAVNFHLRNVYDYTPTVSLTVLTVCLFVVGFVLLRKIISRMTLRLDRENQRR